MPPTEQSAHVQAMHPTPRPTAPDQFLSPNGQQLAPSSPANYFPRSVWNGLEYRMYLFGSQHDEMIWAARQASLAWAIAVEPMHDVYSSVPDYTTPPASKTPGVLVDGACFILSVVDKTLELLHFMRTQNQRRPRKRPRTFSDWITVTDKLIKQSTKLARLALLPSEAPLDCDDDNSVCIPVRSVLNLFFDDYLDILGRGPPPSPPYDESLLDRFAPPKLPPLKVMRFHTVTVDGSNGPILHDQPRPVVVRTPPDNLPSEFHVIRDVYQDMIIVYDHGDGEVEKHREEAAAFALQDHSANEEVERSQVSRSVTENCLDAPTVLVSPPTPDLTRPDPSR